LSRMQLQVFGGLHLTGAAPLCSQAGTNFPWGFALPVTAGSTYVII
jgi:hypothetical protein